jgi:ABC-type phosphate transport system permease subunit
MLERLRRPWSDHRAEQLLGAVACLLAVGIILMVVFIVRGAWPTFSHQGLSWLGSGGDLDSQVGAMVNTSAHPAAAAYAFHAWPLIWGTLLTAGFAVLFGLAISIAAAIFIVDFAPPVVQRTMKPIIRLLAAIPGVLYGLIGILVIVPFIDKHVLTAAEQNSVINVIQLSGGGLGVTILLVTLMITPILTALITDALESVPRPWREGAIALGLNPLRATLAVSIRAIRPAIVAATALATARAIGEAVVVSMVSGGSAFAPNPLDGKIFFLEPVETLASEIVRQADNLSIPVLHSTLYAIASLLLFSSFILSLASYLIRLPMRRYQVSN